MLCVSQQSLVFGPSWLVRSLGQIVFPSSRVFSETLTVSSVDSESSPTRDTGMNMCTPLSALHVTDTHT